jgi:hypothetical protein
MSCFIHCGGVQAVDMVLEVRDARVREPSGKPFSYGPHARCAVCGSQLSRRRCLGVLVLSSPSACLQIPFSSGNPLLNELLGSKKRMVVLNKEDLCDPKLQKVCLVHANKMQLAHPTQCLTVLLTAYRGERHHPAAPVTTASYLPLLSVLTVATQSVEREFGKHNVLAYHVDARTLDSVQNLLHEVDRWVREDRVGHDTCNLMVVSVSTQPGTLLHPLIETN